MDEVWLRVGEVARRTGLTVRTLHHYDELGLLVPSGRSGGDYRLYSADDLRRLLAIQHLKSLGLSLGDIAAALDDPAFDARDAVEGHIAAVEQRIAAERDLLARLRGLREASAAGWDEVLEVIALTERLRHPDPSVRVRAALQARASLPLDALVESLFAEPDAAVRESLTWALARHGPAAVAPLTRHLAARSPDVRLTALHALGKLRSPDAVGAVAPLLADADARVAAKAAFVLGRLGGPDTVAALVDALARPEPLVADEASHALAGLGSEALPALLDALADPDTTRRSHAADALGLLADPESTLPLAAALDDPDSGVRLAALTALAQLPQGLTRDAIAGAARSDDARVRLLARRLLG